MSNNVTPLVSIVIPMYNSLSFVKDTINSCLNQTFSNIEILVVDDNSNDGSYEFVNENFKNKVKLLKNISKGACAARNYGFNESKGKYLLFLDSDDIISKDYISEKVEIFKKYGEYVTVISRVYSFINSLEHSKLLSKKIYSNYKSGLDFIIEMSKQWQPLQVSSWMVSRKVLLISGCWNENLIKNQDGEIFIRILLSSSSVVFAKKCKSFYRQVDNSLSKNKDYFANSSLLNSYILYKKSLDDYSIDYKITANIMRYYYSSFLYLNDSQSKELESMAVKLINDLNKAPLFGGHYIVRKISYLIGFNNFKALIKCLK